MKKIWKDIDDFEGFYQVSNTGEVKSLKRFIKNSRGSGVRSVKERILKPIHNKTTGYLYVFLQKNGVSKPFTIHRLVASAFLQKKINSPEVNHKNCNKKDNNYKNLEWVSTLENRIHAKKNGLLPKGESHGLTKITEKQAIKIKYGHKGLTQDEIAKIYKIHKHTVSNIRRGKRWIYLQ